MIPTSSLEWLGDSDWTQNRKLNKMTKITNFLFLTTLSVAYAGGCDSSPCENGGTCYDIGESGYECICNSFAGKNCQIGKSFFTFIKIN